MDLPHPGNLAMTRLAGLCLALVALSAAPAAPRQAAPRQKGEIEIGDTPAAVVREPLGWVDLPKLTGPDLSQGWTRISIPPERPLDPRNPWSYDPKTGILTCRGEGIHEWLRWDEPAGDFIFHVEWRFVPVPGKKGYNSGVFARNSADGKVWLQAQTGDGSGGYLFGDIPVRGKTERINLAKQVKLPVVQPAGMWNSLEITCQGPKVFLWSNGYMANYLPNCDVRKGYVGLEAEGWHIEFRNVKLKIIPIVEEPPKKAAPPR